MTTSLWQVLFSLLMSVGMGYGVVSRRVPPPFHLCWLAGLSLWWLPENFYRVSPVFLGCVMLVAGIGASHGLWLALLPKADSLREARDNMTYGRSYQRLLVFILISDAGLALWAACASYPIPSLAKGDSISTAVFACESLYLLLWAVISLGRLRAARQ